MTMSDLSVIVGLGVTGVSCARHLHAQGKPFALMDTRQEPPNWQELRKLYPDTPFIFGRLDEALLNSATQLVVSPGVSLQEPAIAKAMVRGIPAVGDIELFAKAVLAPVVAITGTNAKSTVTTLVAHMAEASGRRVAVGGNLGVPALDLLHDYHDADLFVLELSSFQLETTHTLKPQVATILNVSPDHMDRYPDLQHYQQAKYRVYQNCGVAVCNRDDPLTEYHEATNNYYFTLNQPKEREYGLIVRDEQLFLGYEEEVLLPVTALPIAGKHYYANALAALAIGQGLNLPMNAMLSVLREFKGLPHRCQLVRERLNVKWYNDSKGTNVGATLAAIQGLGSEMAGKLIVILGGVGKNADFSPLLPCLQAYARHIVLIGEAAVELHKIIDNRIPTSFADSMADAIEQAATAACTQDSVLLSPACASFDMFKNFEHRGQVYTELVEKLP